MYWYSGSLPFTPLKYDTWLVWQLISQLMNQASSWITGAQGLLWALSGGPRCHIFLGPSFSIHSRLVWLESSLCPEFQALYQSAWHASILAENWVSFWRNWPFGQCILFNIYNWMFNWSMSQTGLEFYHLFGAQLSLPDLYVDDTISQGFHCIDTNNKHCTTSQRNAYMLLWWRCRDLSGSHKTQFNGMAL